MKSATSYEGVLGECLAALAGAEGEDEKAACFVAADVLLDLRAVLKTLVKKR